MVQGAMLGGAIRTQWLSDYDYFSDFGAMIRI
jgi:hypothetical protein